MLSIVINLLLVGDQRMPSCGAYPSTFFADEVTGPDGAVSDKDVTWKEGTRDRRTSGFTSNGGGGSLAVKYADYIIHSNIIMLCQGRDKDQSLERCESIINAVTEETRS